MAEAMALIGLVASVLQLVDTVAKAGTFIKDLHKAPKEQQQLLSEITSLQPLLTALQDRLLSNSSAAVMHIKEPLSAFEDMMKHYTGKLQTSGAFSKVSKGISWTLWNKKEAKEDLDQVERFKSLLNTWLTVDIWDVGQQHDTILKSVEKSVVLVAQEQHQHFDGILKSVELVAQDQQQHFDGILKSVELVAQEQQQHIDDAKRDKILEWMSPLNSFQRQADIFSRWQRGTGGWLLASPQFRDWEAGCGQSLWCRGMSGAGKTVLASLVVHHLEHRSQSENIGVACIYLNYKEAESQTPQNLLGSLWRQLVLGKPIPAVVHALYEKHREQNTRLPLDEVCTILTSSLTSYSKAYLIVDAVDEYPEERRAMLLEALGAIGVNVMLTSRPHIDPDSTALPNMQLVEIQATENDMQQYIDTQISKSSRLSKHVRTRPELADEIRSKILDNVNGMFLLAKLHIDSLTTKNTIKAVKEALHQLPKDLRYTYDEAMERIDHQGEDDRQLAHLTLTWVANAKRPLAVGELQEALAIEPNATDLDPDNLLDISIILSVCAGLVIVDETASVVRLIHYTTQDYLDSIQSQQFPNAQTEITSACLTYLSFQKFTNLPTNLSDWDEGEKLIVQHPFLAYSQYCLAHTVGQPEVHLLGRIIFFLDQASVYRDFWYHHFEYNSRIIPWKFYEEYWPASPLCISVASNLQTISEHLLTEKLPKETLSSALQAGSYCGHLLLVQLLLDHGANVNLVQGYYGTALQAASRQGHEPVVHLLLVHGADVNTLGGDNGTALQAASYSGHGAVVQLLLNHGADVNITGETFGTALQAASFNGHEVVVWLLILHGANVNMPVTLNKKYITVTALQAASYGGHEVIVQFLLDHGANVNTLGGSCRTALQAASSEGHEEVVWLLLDHGADVNITGGNFGIALQAASFNGNEVIVRLLLNHGADVNILGGEYGTALQAASYDGNDAVVQLLLNHGANVNIIGGRYGTALQATSYCGNEAVVQSFLDHGADVNILGGVYGTALQAASCNGNDAVVQLLLNHGANVNILGGEYGTALQAASCNGNDAVVQLLLNHGANVNIIGGRYGTALQATSYCGNEAVVQSFLDHSADVNILGGDYGTALQAASFIGHEGVVLLLIQNGADVNITGGDFETALQAAAASWQKHTGVVQLLLDHGADVNIIGGRYGTALQAASARGDEVVVRLLIQNDADVNAQGGKYGTALEIAQAKNHNLVVELLLEHGANPSVLVDVEEEGNIPPVE
ncbi:ankyrin repeat-containing domain protein [Mycena epipterygia]|nr:ankyrin repeat-containing domain protein [Mycena epipterygia]